MPCASGWTGAGWPGIGIRPFGSPKPSLGAASGLEPLERAEGDSPYAIHGELQTIMNDLVGLIRRESEMKTALVELDKLRTRVAQVSAPGGRAYNPGWHLALDLRNMLMVAECVAQSALERQESRGGHTREDYPAMSPEWRQVNLICSLDADGDVTLRHQPVVPMRTDLLELFDVSELHKYMTDEELAGLPGAEAEDKSAASEFLNRRRLVGQQNRMAQINVCDRSPEHDALGVKAECERACERVIVGLGHENAGKARILGRLRPFDQACWRAVGKNRACECGFGHDELFLFD